ncbi:MAG: TM2 domain-containing protein [Bacteroidia bacterium]|jgi:hypothetical protein
MKTKLNQFFVLAFGLIMLASCTLEKRVYNSGYNISWRSHQSTNSVEGFTEKTNNEKNNLNKPSVENSVFDESKEMSNKSISENVLLDETSTDLINSLSESDQIVASSENSLENVISFKSFETKNQLISKTFVAKTQSKKSLKTNSQNKIIKKEANKIKKENGGGKSKMVALLLCFFLGYLGIHRFYLGYTGWGIVYLFTGGLLGIGALVDFIRILLNMLKPKNGDYE